MTDLTPHAFDRRVREALLSVRAPEAAKTRTLDAIEALRTQEPAEHPDASEMPGAAGELDQTATTKSAPTDHNDAAAPSPTSRSRNAARRRRWRTPLAAAACLALVGLLCFTGYRIYQQPAAFVGLDVNPSLELTVNSFDRVVAAAAINEDGRAVLDGVHLEGKSYEEALDCLMASEAMAPYVTEDAFVEVSITADNDAIAAELQGQSDAVLARYPCRGACHHADDATRQAAAAAGMGVGRYRAACELMALDGSVTLDECAAMTMRELHDALDRLCEDDSHDHGNGTGSGQGHGAGHGHGAGQGQGHGQEHGAGRGTGTSQHDSE